LLVNTRLSDVKEKENQDRLHITHFIRYLIVPISRASQEGKVVLNAARHDCSIPLE
jgi:hypothetical protein